MALVFIDQIKKCGFLACNLANLSGREVEPSEVCLVGRRGAMDKLSTERLLQKKLKDSGKNSNSVKREWTHGSD